MPYSLYVVLFSPIHILTTTPTLQFIPFPDCKYAGHFIHHIKLPLHSHKIRMAIECSSMSAAMAIHSKHPIATYTRMHSRRQCSSPSAGRSLNSQESLNQSFKTHAPPTYTRSYLFILQSNPNSQTTRRQQKKRAILTVRPLLFFNYHITSPPRNAAPVRRLSPPHAAGIRRQQAKSRQSLPPTLPPAPLASPQRRVAYTQHSSLQPRRSIA